MDFKELKKRIKATGKAEYTALTEVGRKLSPDEVRALSLLVVEAVADDAMARGAARGLAEASLRIANAKEKQARPKRPKRARKTVPITEIVMCAAALDAARAAKDWAKVARLSARLQELGGGQSSDSK